MENTNKHAPVILSLLSIYAFILLGFVFHTSANPQIFGKYTFVYFIGLLLSVILIVPLVFLLRYLLYESKFLMFSKKIIFTSRRKTITLFILFIILFIASELFFRIKYNNRHDLYGSTLNQYDVFLQNKLSTESNLHVDSDGFRNDEISKAKPRGTYRIFVLGGSTVLSPYVGYNKSSVKVLGDMLNDHYKNQKIEVINAGNDWYTSEHSLIQYLFKIKDYQPDMIIIWQGVNDVYRSCTPQEYSISGYKSDYSHFVGSISNIIDVYFKEKPFIAINSFTYQFLLHTFQSNFYSDLSGFLSKNVPSKNTYQGVPMHDFQSIEAYKRNLKSIITNVRADNVELIIGNQPYLYKDHMSSLELSKLWLLKMFCNNNGKYPDIQSSITVLNEFNNATKDLANANKVDFVDLASKVPKNLSYFIDDVHTNENGDKMIAKTLYEFITQNNLINF